MCSSPIAGIVQLQSLSDSLDVQQVAVTDVIRGGGAAQGAATQH